MQENYRPARGLPLVCEAVTAVHHWREFFAPLEQAFSGVVGTKTTADAAHVLRVVQRQAVRAAAPEVDWSEQQEGHAEDPVLLAKHWLCSRALSQPPTPLLLQSDLVAALDFGKLRGLPAPRSWLNEDSLKKYRRTADEVLQEPWCLHTAYSFLTSWLQRNEAQTPGKLPEIDFVTQGRDYPEPNVEVPATWRDFAPEGAVEIRPVKRLPKKNMAVHPKTSEGVAPELAQRSRREMAQANLGGPHGGGASGLGGEGEAEGDAEQNQDPPAKRSGKCGDLGLLAADAEAEAGWLPLGVANHMPTSWRLQPGPQCGCL